MNTIWLKRGALVAGAAAILGGLVYAMLPRPAAVDVGKIARGEMRVTVDEEGKTRIKEIFVVSAPIAGKVLRSKLTVGDDVTADLTEVATLVPTAPPMLDIRARSELVAMISAAEDAVRLAESELAQAQSEAKMAELELKRASDLAKRGFAAERVLDRASTDAGVRRAAVAKALSAVEVRKHELATAQARLLETGTAGSGAAVANPVSVKAPQSGKVLRIPVENEAAVPQGAPLVEIGDPGKLEIVVDLLSADAVKVQRAADASIEGWGGASVLSAKVKRIEPTGFTKVSALGIEEQRVRTVLDFAGPPSGYQALGHDFRVFVRIQVWRSTDALRVPLGALFRDGDRWAVFKIDATRAKLQAVELGHRNADYAEVVSGLVDGDVVVLHPNDRVTDGATVEVRG